MTVTLHPTEVHAPRVLDLASHGDLLAVRTAGESLTYADLARRVEDTAARLGATRRLVLVEGANSIDALVAHLAALTSGHVVLLAAPGRPAEQLAEAWDPDVVVRDGRLVERRDGTRHDLHPDLALLLSTSGSTGSPKLVRLSADNLRSNAASIATYLGLTPQDRAITSLPMHYCYGLSVLHSHLLVGAAVVLTDLSVVDDCFWRLAAEAGASSFAGVPYTFELLERSGFDARRVPTLRYVTQAGGRLDPSRVRDWSARGRRAGWDLVVMYGQTEATARMAWLPPELAVEHPGSIGVPVPGGDFRIEPVPEASEPGVGELVYRGPNVMMGYAESPA
ncbi:MAG TPA: AMP-binding protein, partial [Nocardioides sp.]|nr:AMP-binding protein [Nocardioides sp.]